jgi:hypothetical protein
VAPTVKEAPSLMTLWIFAVGLSVSGYRVVREK